MDDQEACEFRRIITQQTIAYRGQGLRMPTKL